VLGEGSAKRVYLARDTHLDRSVAISALDSRGLRHPALDALHEARAMARIGDHPHVVSIYDVIEGGESLYIVSRFLSGGNLEARLEARDSRALPMIEAIRIVSQVCRALEHAHANGIAHCDLKPGNIFLDESGAAHLGDFGLAEVQGTTRSRDDQITGTPAYLAPERISGAARGPACDLYALGCLLYELTTGRAPFVSDSAAELLRLHQVARPAPPVDRDPSIPPALSDLILKLLEKEPGARPASARDVRAALQGILDLGARPASSAAMRRRGPAARTGRSPERRISDPAALVSREDELAALEAALDRARQGAPSLVLVRGEAGLGKSRLLRELHRMADDKGSLALFGQGYQDVPLPFRPFVEALLPLAGRLSELPPDRAEVLREFLYLQRGSGDQEMITGREVQHHRLFVSVFAALAAFSHPRPLILTIDDLHWADSASLDLFEHLAFALTHRAPRADLELMLVGSFRPTGAEERLTRILERLERESACESLELSPLSDSGVFELLTDLGISHPSDQLVHRVREVTEGNPLFVREVADHLVRSGSLVEQRGSTVSSNPAQQLLLPSSVTGSISSRTSLLSESCREVLTLASFLGARFERDQLASLAASSADALSDALEEAVAHEVLLDEGHAYRFAHPLLRQVVYQLPSSSRRQRIHLRIAEHLEAGRPPDPQAAELAIAHHLVRAGSLANPSRLARYASRAADHALGKYAWHEAAELLEAAIAAGERDPGFAPAEAAELHRKAGLAYFRRQDSGPCLHHYDTAAEGFRRVEDTRGLARTLNERARATVWLGLAPFEGSADVKPLEEALQSLGAGEPDVRAQLMTTLAESYWAARRVREAEQIGTAALETASEIGDHRLCAEVSINLGLIRYQTLRVEDALSTWRVGAAHARRAQDLFAEERCLQRMLLALFAKGRFEEVERTAREVAEMNRVLQVPSEASITQSILLGVAAIRGDSRAAERHGDEALDQVRRAKYPWTAVMALPALTCVRAMRGDVSGAHAAIDLLFEPGIMFEDRRFFEPMARDLRQLVAWYAGDPVSIDAARAEGRGGADGGPGIDLVVLTDVCTKVELADALQSPELALGSREALVSAQENAVFFLSGWPFFVPRLLGVLALLEGAWDEAELQLDRALQIAESAGAGPEHARSQLDMARLLSVRNATGDRPRARELLRAALPPLRAYFPGGFLARAEKLLAFLDGDEG
jgi:tetratricopeptide (TPR) repeat protein